LPVWEDEEEEEEEEEEEGRGARGCFIFEDVPDFSMPDDDLPPLPFLTTLIPVDDFLTPTLWVVEAPIDVMAFAKGNIFIYYNSMRKAAARGPEERIDNIEQCVGDSQLGSNQIESGACFFFFFFGSGQAAHNLCGQCVNRIVDTSPSH
jgi:hypothetical protein